MIELITLGMVILGMWGAFYLGSRRQEEKIFESFKDHKPEKMDIPDEVSGEEYEKQLRSWKIYGEETVTDAG